jgi:hypothetical protein
MVASTWSPYPSHTKYSLRDWLKHPYLLAAFIGFCRDLRMHALGNAQVCDARAKLCEERADGAHHQALRMSLWPASVQVIRTSAPNIGARAAFFEGCG